MFITPHFTLEEMTVSQIACREGLDNTPDPQVLDNLQHLCQALEHVRSLVDRPVLISSGYRSQALNQRVGGAPNSAHTHGLAADFTVVGLSPRELAEQIEACELAFDQLILEFDSWVHLAVTQGDARREVLTLRRGTGYLPGIQ